MTTTSAKPTGRVDLPPIWFGNFDNNRPQAAYDREFGAIVGTSLIPLAKRPLLVAGTELPGAHLRDHTGYRLIRRTEGATKAARRAFANVAAYVRSDVEVVRVTWTKMRRRWAKRKGGRHEPRAFVALVLRWAGITFRVIVAHHPPDTRDSGKARAEHLRRLANAAWPRWERRQGRRLPTVVLWDSNGAAGALARLIHGKVVGDKVDCAVIAGGFRRHDHGYRAEVRDVAMESDHGHAFRASLTLAA